MKITTQQIKKIINEEIQYLLKETYGPTATPEQRVVELFLEGDRASAEQALMFIRMMGDEEFKKTVIFEIDNLIKQYEGYRRGFDDTTTMDERDDNHHILTYAERALKAIESDSLDYDEDAYWIGDPGLDIY